MSDAIKNAIEAMEFAQHAVGPFNRVATKKLRESIAELQAAQAQAQAGDGSHVGEALACGDPDRTIATFNSDRVPVGAKLYTAPPAAVNQQLPEGYVLAPVEPTEAMIDMGVAVAFAASVHGKGGWNKYMKALYRAFIAAAQEQKL